uniref:Uncharacterized protein n=1 Tax=Alexandrium monilatum TaxID=311494 RepID=A0A7S4QSH3_9DINO
MAAWLSRPGPSERELPSGACTPPREDDLATRPRLVCTPRDSQFREPGVEHPAIAVTRQACSILLLIGCIFGVAMAVIVGLYTAVSTMVENETEVGHCQEQPITNGVIKAGFVNGTVEVRCSPGFKLGPLPEAARELRCRLLAQHCMVLKAATIVDDPVRRCSHTYAYTLVQPEGARQVAERPEEEEEEEALAEARLVADRAMRGACVPDLRHAPSRLYREPQAPLKVAEVVRDVKRARWTTTTSSVAMSALMLSSLAALVGAGIGRARTGGGIACAEPETAALLDANDEEGWPSWLDTANVGEDSSDAEQGSLRPL